MREFLPAVREHGALAIAVNDLLNEDGKLDLYPEVTGKNYIRAKLSGDTVELAAGSFVGMIALNDRYAITVKPRIDVARFSRLLRVSGYTPVALDELSREYGIEPEQLDSIVELLATAFLAALDAVICRGLRQGYIERDAETSFPRGRIRIGRTISEFARGARHRVSASWFEPSADIPENRLLKYALWHLAGKYHNQQRRQGHRAILADINRLLRALDEVELDAGREFLQVPDLRDPARYGNVSAYYVPAVGLAHTLILHEGIDLASTTGSIALSSLLLSMEAVFEGYVRETLRIGLAARVPDAKVLDGNIKPPEGAAQPLFTDNDSVLATPDIVVQPSGTAKIVLELKYKPATNRDDLNQIIGYGMSYGADDVILVHLNTGDAPRSTFRGTAGTVRVHQYAIDLTGDLEAEEGVFCDFIAALIPTRSQANNA
jgi:5-methylcytosine-specific restriction endonuclease McrBC regulatory subunit McrC